MLRQNKIHVLKIIFCFILTIGVLPPFTLFLDANAKNESNEFISEEQSYVLKEEEDFCFSESSSSDSETNEYTNVDVPKESTNNELDKELSNGDYEDDTIISSEKFTEEESSEEPAANSEINLSKSSTNEIEDCAYFLNESVGTYRANFFYFFGYKIDELEKASLSGKAVKCNWTNRLKDFPSNLKLAVKGVIFDQSAKNIKPKSLEDFFTTFSSCESFEGLNYLDTSLVESMNNMFSSCSTVKHLDLASFDLTNVESMGRMFINCNLLKNIIFSKTAKANKIVNMQFFCCGCFNLESIVLPSLSFASINNMKYHNDMENYNSMELAFNDCHKLKNIDLSNFDSSNVTNMSCLFRNCRELEYLDLSHFNTPNVWKMTSMFSLCKSLKVLDLSEFDTSNVVHINGMFSDCYNLKTIYVKKNFALDKISYQDKIFDGCTSLVGGAGTTYDYPNHYNRDGACIDSNINGTWGVDKGYFTKIEGVAYFILENIDSYKANTLYFLGHAVPELEQAVRDQQASKFLYENTAESSIFSEIASKCTNIVFDESASRVSPSSTYNWFNNFRNCESIEGLNYLNTSNVTNMKGMFRNCSLLSEINLENFDTSNVVNMSEMFSRCTAINNLDLSTFNTTNANTMEGMFANCPELTVLNLENFDTSNVVNMSEMFTKNYNLKTIYVTELFSTEKVTKSDNMFKDCFALVGGSGTKYDPSYIDISAACIDKAGKLWGVDRGYLTCGKYTPQPPEKPEQKAAVENSTNENYESVATSPTTGETNTLLIISLVAICLVAFRACCALFKIKAK